MASICRRGKYWHLLERKNGKLVSRSLHLTSKLDANDYLMKYRANTALSKLGMPMKDVTFQDFLNRYETYSKANKAPNSILRDKNTLKAFLFLCPIANLDEFNIQILEDYKSKRRSLGIKESSINRELNTLKAMGAKMQEWGYGENPVKSVKKLREQDRKIRFFTEEELQKIFTNISGVWHTLATIGLYTGCRPLEILNLKWHHIDTKGRLISVEATKTYKLRHIPINDTLLAYLLKIKRINEYVVTYSDGSRPIGNVLSSYFRKVFKRLHIDNARFYTFRHTFATNLVMGGVPITIVQALLGHTSLDMTMVYAHNSPKFLTDSVQVLNKLAKCCK